MKQTIPNLNTPNLKFKLKSPGLWQPRRLWFETLFPWKPQVSILTLIEDAIVTVDFKAMLASLNNTTARTVCLVYNVW